MTNQALSPSHRDEAFTVLTESDLEVWDQEVRVYQNPPAAKVPPMPQRSQAPPVTAPSNRGQSTAAGKGSFLAPQSKSRVVGVASIVGTVSPGTPSQMSRSTWLGPPQPWSNGGRNV